LIGVNNQYQNKPFDFFEKEFDEIIKRSFSILNDSSQLFVVSIPDYAVTPFGGGRA
jgi:hypothetical protein